MLFDNWRKRTGKRDGRNGIQEMDRQDRNVLIFEDSMELIRKNKRLREAVKTSVATQKMVTEIEWVGSPLSDRDGDKGSHTGSCKTVVSRKRSFEAAQPYAKAGKKVCVLNFASSTGPGGGVEEGCSAQEECLCRCSTLYPCLSSEEMLESFYYPHRARNIMIGSDDCIYTPGVVVFKSDISFPERMEEEDWYTVDVLTCAAPDLRWLRNDGSGRDREEDMGEITDEELKGILLNRIERIFQLAASNGAEVLILGAFGCGAFRNPPKIVAEAFFEIQKIYGAFFDTIEYAVFCGGGEQGNYVSFCEQFGMPAFYDVSRFLEAQEESYECALAELKRGCKESHWMWYIFPQLTGLGYSRTARFYALSGLAEARAYLDDPVLKARMKELCEVLLASNHNDAEEIFPYPDDLKFCSCMTLFEQADSEDPIYGQLLDKMCGGRRDEKTLQLLKG